MNFKSTIRPILAETLFWVCTGILQTLLERARHGYAPKRGERGGEEVIAPGCTFCTLCVAIPCREHLWGKPVHLICMSWLLFQVLPSEELWKPQNVPLSRMLPFTFRLLKVNLPGKITNKRWQALILEIGNARYHRDFYHFLQTRDWLSLLHLIFLSFPTAFFTHHESQRCQFPRLLQALWRSHRVRCPTGKWWFLEKLLVLTAPYVDRCNASTFLLHLSYKCSVDRENCVSCLLLCLFLL